MKIRIPMAHVRRNGDYEGPEPGSGPPSRREANRVRSPEKRSGSEGDCRVEPRATNRAYEG